jgi:hypothetical protein
MLDQVPNIMAVDKARVCAVALAALIPFLLPLAACASAGDSNALQVFTLQWNPNSMRFHLPTALYSIMTDP